MNKKLEIIRNIYQKTYHDKTYEYNQDNGNNFEPNYCTYYYYNAKLMINTTIVKPISKKKPLEDSTLDLDSVGTKVKLGTILEAGVFDKAPIFQYEDVGGKKIKKTIDLKSIKYKNENINFETLTCTYNSPLFFLIKCESFISLLIFKLLNDKYYALVVDPYPTYKESSEIFEKGYNDETGLQKLQQNFHSFSGIKFHKIKQCVQLYEIGDKNRADMFIHLLY
jgi:hypothetical protein